MKPYPSYKESGIEWLGEIPEHWEVNALKRLCNIQGRIGFKGYTKADLVDKDKGALTLGAKHINKNNKINLSDPEYISWDKYYESPEIMINLGDLLVTQRGSLGKVAIICEDIGKATINPSMVIISKLQARPNYLYYYFHGNYFNSKVEIISSTTAVPMITQEQLGNFLVLLPSDKEQTQIATFLDQKTNQIDDLIAKKEKLIELLKEERTAIINQAVTKGLPAEAREKAGLDPNVPMKDSGIEWLGEIPDSWEVSYLKRFCLKITDGSHFSPQSIKTGRPYVTVKDVNNGIIDFGNCLRISNEDYDLLVKNGCKPKENDILLSKDGTIGRGLVVNGSQDFVILSSLGLIRPNPNIINSLYLFYYLLSGLNIDQMFSYIKGSALTRITIEVIKHLVAPLPPIDVQSEITDYLDDKTHTINASIYKIEKEINLLNEYKTSLINEAVTGKFDVRDYQLNHV